jgi:hypothetical protein
MLMRASKVHVTSPDRKGGDKTKDHIRCFPLLMQASKLAGARASARIAGDGWVGFAIKASEYRVYISKTLCFGSLGASACRWIGILAFAG